MQNDFGPKYKHLQNLITKKLYSLLAVDGDSFVSQSGFQVIAYLHDHRDSQITQKNIAGNGVHAFAGTVFLIGHDIFQFTTLYRQIGIFMFLF